MPWGGLNPALTAWRNGINTRFPKRGTGSDGGYADAVHGSSSEHQVDADGTVDAFDCDINFLASAAETGSATERRIAAALRSDFQADRRAQLWISYRQIANRDIGPWTVRPYGGASPHDHHIHFQSRQAFERDGSPWKYPRTDALLRELNGDDMPTADEIANAVWARKIASPALGIDPRPAGDWLKGAEQARREVSALGKSLTAAITALAAKDQVDEQALGAALAPGVAALIIPALPAGSEVTEEKLQAAIVGALRELASQES